MNDITLQQIEIFLTVAEQMNLSEAAKDLFINQSAVSRWIIRLEASLNTKLFVRNNRGVELTPDGEFLYAELHPVYSRLSETLQRMRSLYDMPSSILRVGCLDADEIMDTLKAIVGKFEATHPDVLIKIEPFTFKDLRENLALGNIDCAIAYSIGFGEYHTIKSKHIEKMNSYFAISSRHPLLEGGELDASRLGGENLFVLTPAEMSEAEDRALSICRAHGFVPREIKYLPSLLSIEIAVKELRGVSINGLNFGRRFPGEIRLFKIDNVERDQYLIIAWREGGCSDITKQFLDSMPEVKD